METVIILGLYIIAMVGIGIYSMKHTKTVDSFLLGDRNLGPWMSAFAYGTTFFSAVIFIGYAGKNGWVFGMSSIWIGVGNAIIGCLLSWLILAKKTRSMTHKLDVKTMPELFEARFDSKIMKIFSAALIFIFLTPYSASVYMGLGYLFETIFNIDYFWCMVIMASLTALYLVLGGYMASIITDFFQGIIMIVGVLIMVGLIVNNEAVGGIMEGVQKLSLLSGDGADVGQLTAWFGGSNWLQLIGLIFLTSVGTWGLPQMVHKFYTIKDEKSIKQASIISTIFAVIIGCSAYFIGSFGRLFLNNNLDTVGGSFDAIMPYLLNNALPAIMMSIVLVFILSASMSTLSALVMTSASAISVDLIKGYFKPDIKEKPTVLLLRILCLIFVLISFLIAVFRPKEIITLMSFSWGTIAGSFLGPYVWGLYSKKITKIGAWSGMLAGFFVSMGLAIIFNFDGTNAPLFGTYAMLASLIVTPLVSLFTPKYSADFVKKVFEQ